MLKLHTCTNRMQFKVVTSVVLIALASLAQASPIEKNDAFLSLQGRGVPETKICQIVPE